MISPEFFEVIRKRLCPELKRYIFQYIDIETRIQMLLEKRQYFVTGSTRLPTNDLNANLQNPFWSLLGGQRLATIYKEGWLKQLFDLKGTNWFIKPEGSREGDSLMQFLMKKMNANPPNFIQLQHMNGTRANQALQAAGANNLELY